ncbi:MAG: diguanylate cyclase [Pirellulales bacterium]|nr:diguanylate cyclase [Pirellulales bacterium]
MPIGPWTPHLDALLQELEDVTVRATAAPAVAPGLDNQLPQVRLGVASSLFTALHCKHPPTAAHVLRVALTASGWCVKLGLSDAERDRVEVAALLHDVGVIGIPDRILQKPNPLTPEEVLIIEQTRQMSVEILRGACAEPAILEIIQNVPARFDGAKPGYTLSREDIPLGARMIAIVESFDAMTSERVFRPAMSQEAAVAELFKCAGAQFDPELVRAFVELQKCDQNALREATASRWIQSLGSEAADACWRRAPRPAPQGIPDAECLFRMRLLDNMHDAVIFVDAALALTFWNHGAERMTGISARSVLGRQWSADLLNLRDERGQTIGDVECPVVCTIHSGVQSLRRLTVLGRIGRPVSVDAHVIPVLAEDGVGVGAVLLLHDASSEISLEERCHNLHERATKDPLTHVANRAEFDRVHEMFVVAHLQRKRPCSLIICDLDWFKQVNDTYGHQAGDDVIKSLAGVLKNSCRAGDLVARYGGEEFVMLYAECDNATAAARAEHIRKTFSEIAHARMDDRSVTASFGVTEIQPGDTAETMLRRADRALLLAKSKGRNTVVQLGTGSVGSDRLDDDAPWNVPPPAGEMLFEQHLVTSVPMTVAVEKLRGFVADHQAAITEINHNNLQLEIDHQGAPPPRRRGDRPTTFVIGLRFEEEHADRTAGNTPPGAPTSRGTPRTRIHFTIAPRSDRDRRRGDILDQARDILVSFRSYLMASEEGGGLGGEGDKDKAVSKPPLDAYRIGPTRRAAGRLWNRIWRFFVRG